MNAILETGSLGDDWLVITNYTGSGQPEGSIEEWREVLAAMSERKRAHFKRIAVEYDMSGKAWFWSPRNSSNHCAASVDAADIDEWVTAAKASHPALSSAKVADSMNTIPRRNDILKNSTAEVAIRDAMRFVEEAGAHPLLTDASVLLGQAFEKVADFVDGTAKPLQPHQLFRPQPPKQPVQV